MAERLAAEPPLPFAEWSELFLLSDWRCTETETQTETET